MQDCRTLTLRIHMAMLEISNIRFRLTQLLGQIAKRRRFNITVTTRWKTAMTAEKTQLKRNPYPTRPVELADKTEVVKTQAPNLDE